MVFHQKWSPAQLVISSINKTHLSPMCFLFRLALFMSLFSFHQRWVYELCSSEDAWKTLLTYGGGEEGYYSSVVITSSTTMFIFLPHC